MLIHAAKSFQWIMAMMMDADADEVENDDVDDNDDDVVVADDDDDDDDGCGHQLFVSIMVFPY